MSKLERTRRLLSTRQQPGPLDEPAETAADHGDADSVDDERRLDDRRRYAIHAAVFAALVNPTRHELMHYLCDGAKTPGELAAPLEVGTYWSGIGVPVMEVPPAVHGSNGSDGSAHTPMLGSSTCSHGLNALLEDSAVLV